MSYYADQQIMVGGLALDGADGTNDLSYMLLDVAAQHRLLIDLDARVHRGTPDAFLRKCAEVTQYNLGFSIFGDDATVAGLVRAGIPERDARRYSIVGCVEVVIPDVAAPRTMEHQFNLAKCLELALNDGKCQLSGVQIGLQTGDPRAFTTYAQVLDAYHTQVAYFERLVCEATNAGHRVQQDFVPLPFLSGTIEGCVESAKDLTAGGARLNPSGGCVPGLADVPDALAAVKKVVFEDCQTDMATLIDALDANLDGHDALRDALLCAPKFGNADPYVDQIARDEQLFDYDLVMRYRTEHGGPFLRLQFSGSDGVTFQWGPRTGALPNGRLARTPIAISVSPCQESGAVSRGRRRTRRAAPGNARDAKSYPMQGIVLALDNLVKGDKAFQPDDVYQGVKDLSTYQGKTYAVSETMTPQGFFVNRDRVKQSGVDPDRLPNTLQDLEQVVPPLFERDANGYAKVGWVPWIPQALPVHVLAAAGADWYDPKTDKVTANSPACVQVFEWLKGYAGWTKLFAEQVVPNVKPDYIFGSAALLNTQLTNALAQIYQGKSGTKDALVEVVRIVQNDIEEKKRK